MASIVESTNQEWKQRHVNWGFWTTLHLRILPFPDPLTTKLMSYLVCCLSESLSWLAGCVAFTHPLPPSNRLKVTSLRLSLSTPRSCRLFGNIHTWIHIFWVRYVEDSKCAHAWVLWKEELVWGGIYSWTPVISRNRSCPHIPVTRTLVHSSHFWRCFFVQFFLCGVAQVCLLACLRDCLLVALKCLV